MLKTASKESIRNPNPDSQQLQLQNHIETEDCFKIYSEYVFYRLKINQLIDFD